MASTTTTTTRKIPLICSGHSRPVPEFNYSGITPDGFFLVSACLDGKAMLRNGETGDWVGTFVGHKGAVWSAHVNKDATKTLTGSADYTAKLWNALNGEEVHTFTHSRIVKSVRFSPDEKRVMTAGQDKLIRVFELGKETEAATTLDGHTETIKQTLWADESMVISAAPDGVRLWDLRTKKEVKRLTTTNTSSIQLSADKSGLLVSSGKSVTLYSISNHEVVKQQTVSVDINSAVLSADNKHFALGCNDFSVRLLDYTTGKELEVLKGHHGPVHCVGYSPDAATVASGSEDGTIRLWLNGEPRAYGLWAEKDHVAAAPTSHH